MVASSLYLSVGVIAAITHVYSAWVALGVFGPEMPLSWYLRASELTTVLLFLLASATRPRFPRLTGLVVSGSIASILCLWPPVVDGGSLTLGLWTLLGVAALFGLADALLGTPRRAASCPTSACS